MTPEDHRQAAQLEVQHRRLQLELKDWKAATAQDIRVGNNITVGVPQDAFTAFRSAVIAHIDKAIKTNREQFEAL